MLRWCVFCQRYLGEAEPWNDFSITHDICSACRARSSSFSVEDQQRALPVQRFYERLSRVAKQGIITSPSALLEESRQLGIRPLDLIMGLLQPILYEIGELWSRGLVTTSSEHLFSSMVSAVLNLVFEEDEATAPKRRADRPAVLLVQADGNYHSLGMQIVELALACHRIDCVAFYPGLPASEVGRMARDLKPAFVGISVSMIEQREAVRDTCAKLTEIDEPSRPRVLIGGLAVKGGASLGLDLPVLELATLSDLLALLSADLRLAA